MHPKCVPNVAYAVFTAFVAQVVGVVALLAVTFRKVQI
jgi:hypothetical protein